MRTFAKPDLHGGVPEQRVEVAVQLNTSVLTRGVVLKPSVACVVLALLSPLSLSQVEKTSDLEKIQGLWKATAAESEGKALDADDVKDMYIAFAGNRMIPFGEGDIPDAVYAIKLNDKTEPKEIELSYKVLGKKTMTAGGIYEIDGDTLKLCWDQDGGKRPTSFVTAKPGKAFSVVLKREKLK
jgi:uncharacterized protein (TIGR03067 family)